MTVDEEEITAGEFARYYAKQSEEREIDDCLEDLILYKLKVADALSEKLDTTKSFKASVKAFRDQLGERVLDRPKDKRGSVAYRI